MGTEIILAAQISGTRNGKDWPPAGSRLELPDDEAASLVKNGSAYALDDERARFLGNGNGGAAFADEMLAGAPEGRDWTEGQQDTNLARARFLALQGEDSRAIAREAAERAGLTDAETVPGAGGSGAVVGDDNPNPTDLPSPVNRSAEVGSEPTDDGARLIESAAVTPSGETATVDSTPSGRKGRRTSSPASTSSTSSTSTGETSTS